MKTPKLFSHGVTESVLPEVLGERYQKVALKLAQQSGHRCEVTGYPYPPIAARPGQPRPTTPLMIEPREEDGQNRPLPAKVVRERLKREGLTPKTVRMVCPLVFWARHVDLAVKYGRGNLIFAPWITQGETITLFRTLMIADAQTGHDPDHPVYEQSSEIIEAINVQMGNHGLLTEVLALPEDTEWDPDTWLKTVRSLPTRERRIYIDRFAKHLRFWPAKSAFSVLSGYWANHAHAPEASVNPETTESQSSGSWVRRYYPIFSDSLDRLSRRSAERTAASSA